MATIRGGTIGLRIILSQDDGQENQEKGESVTSIL